MVDDVSKSSGLLQNDAAFTMAGCFCPLWRAPVLAKHAVAIFSPTAAKQQWSIDNLSV